MIRSVIVNDIPGIPINIYEQNFLLRGCGKIGLVVCEVYPRKKIIKNVYNRSPLVKKTKNRPTETERGGCRGSKWPKTRFSHYSEAISWQRMWENGSLHKSLNQLFLLSGMWLRGVWEQIFEFRPPKKITGPPKWIPSFLEKTIKWLKKRHIVL